MSVPEEEIPALRSLLSLTKDHSGKLIRALKEVAPRAHLGSLVTEIASATGMKPEDLFPILRMLVSLHQSREVLGASPAQFSSEVVEAAREAKVSAQPKELERLREFLSQTLSFEGSLGLSAKAYDLLWEHQNVFCSARVLTDIRPVFGKSISAAPPRGLIVHDLKIHYHREEGTKELFVSMETKDLENLRGIIDRALEKEASLRQEFESTHLVLLGSQPKKGAARKG